MTATVALAEQDGRWTADTVATVAEAEGDGSVLTGTKDYVVDGTTADLLLVIARDGADEVPGVYAVGATGPGLRREPLIGLDPTRRLARIVLDRAAAERVGPADERAAIAPAGDVSRVLLAAEETGGAQARLEMTAEYARTRIQFGRAIGSFQAVEQRLADMLVKVESARSAGYAADRIVADGPSGTDPDAPVATRSAALTAGGGLRVRLRPVHPAARRHRLHLGARRPPLLQARPDQRGTAGHESEHLAVLAELLDAEAARAVTRSD